MPMIGVRHPRGTREASHIMYSLERPRALYDLVVAAFRTDGKLMEA
jgi:hypothetical protein